MGVFRAAVEIGNPTDQTFAPVEALVDTGASHTVIPAPLLHQLGIQPHVREMFELADGQIIEFGMGRALARIKGREEMRLVVFGRPDTEPLLGAYTLEGLRLAPDPVHQRLVPVHGLMKILATALAVV